MVIGIVECHRGRAQYGQNYRERTQYDQSYRGDFRSGNFRETQNYRGQTFRGGYRGSLRNSNFDRGRFRERQHSGNFRRNDRSSSRSRLDSRTGTNRDGIRCFKHREYDYFVKDCPNMSETEKDQTEQMQQMLDVKGDKTALKVIVADAYENLIRTNSEETIDHLN